MANSNPCENQHVVFSVNPKAGVGPKSDVVERAIAAIEARGFAVESCTDLEKMRARSLALFKDNKLRTVVAAGGDGTIGLLANLLPYNLPLSILPLGTQNLLAKHYQITLDPELLAERITHGVPVKVDSGIANDKRFLVVASCGFDAEVVARFANQRTGHTSYVSWARSIWTSVWNYRYPTIRIYADDNEKPLIAKWAFAFNFPSYALALPIAPSASPDDGVLDLVAFRGAGLWNGLLYLIGVLLRSHRGWRDITNLTFTKLRIESDKPVPYQLDGDPGGSLPLEITIERDSLTLLLTPEN